MKQLIALLIFSWVLMAGLTSCQKDDDATGLPSDDDLSPKYEQYGTPFDGVPAAEDVVMYEVNLRAFSSTGDLQGVIDGLDHIKELGVNVIWLMPIHPIGSVNSVNSPYSVKDFKAVSSEYGTLQDLRKLTDEAHERGMAVIMDWVANHTAWDNEWINNKSWYTQNADGEIVHPPGTNWMDVADLNFDNDLMREAMIDAMKYWLYEANIDGFRCDYADGVPFDFWQAAWQAIDSIPDRRFVRFAEGARKDHFEAGFDLCFGWSFYGAVKAVFDGQGVSRIFNTHNSEYTNVPEGKHWLRFTTNHDESAWDATPISLFNGVKGALAASVVTTFVGGVPLIYGSQEVGTANTIPFFSNSNINWNNNPEMLETYQAMFQFYSNSDAAKKGLMTVYQNSDIACFRKSWDGESILILANMRNADIDFDVPLELDQTSWTDALSGEAVLLSTSQSLQPYQFYILEE